MLKQILFKTSAGEGIFFCLVGFNVSVTYIVFYSEFSSHYFCGLVFIYVRVPALTGKGCVLFGI